MTEDKPRTLIKNSLAILERMEMEGIEILGHLLEIESLPQSPKALERFSLISLRSGFNPRRKPTREFFQNSETAPSSSSRPGVEVWFFMLCGQAWSRGSVHISGICQHFLGPNKKASIQGGVVFHVM